MENKKLVVANLKMDMDATEVSEYLKSIVGKINNSNIIICPSAIYVPYFLKHRFSIGMQNVCEESNGNYTGEISARQAASLGIKYSLVGHSERRINYYEDNDSISRKINSLLKNNMTPILCVGETNEEKNLLKTNKVLKSKLVSCLENVNKEDISKIIISYEPIWAVGSKRIPTMAEIKNTVKYIKELIKKIYGIDIKVIYGGSINSSNIEKIKKIECLDGVMIGSSSTVASEFMKILEVIDHE